MKPHVQKYLLVFAKMVTFLKMGAAFQNQNAGVYTMENTFQTVITI